MLIKDVMTKNVLTVPSSTTVGEALKLLGDHGFRRLPVVDDGKLVGIVSDRGVEQALLTGTVPRLRQIAYLIDRTTLSDIMIKEVVTISPGATLEQGIVLAQKHRIGSLVVVEEGKVVGIVTTNDFFYKVVNPILGIGETGVRIMVRGAGDGKAAEKILSCINKLGIGLKLIWTLPSSESNRNDIIVQLDTEEPGRVIQELENLGYKVDVRTR